MSVFPFHACKKSSTMYYIKQLDCFDSSKQTAKVSSEPQINRPKSTQCHQLENYAEEPFDLSGVVTKISKLNQTIKLML